MSEKTRGGFTRGLCEVKGSAVFPPFPLTAPIHYPCTEITRDRSIVETKANASLIAAAFNAATEAEDMGYDGLEAVRALPELLRELSVVTTKIGVYIGPTLRNPSGLDDMLILARALLARLKGGSDG